MSKPTTSTRMMIVAFCFIVLGIAAFLDYRWSVNADAHESARILFCGFTLIGLVFFALAFIFFEDKS